MAILILMFISVVFPMALFMVDDVVSRVKAVSEMKANQDFYDRKFERKFGIKAIK